MSSTDNLPRLSVLMSVYNGEEYLASAIDSVLAQTFTDFEFIIINDGSTDRSLDILRSYADRDSRIRIVDQENTGLTEALRRGVAETRAPLIARMDADDFSLPRRFARQVEMLDAQPDIVAASCHVEHFKDNGTVAHVAADVGPPEIIPLLNCFANRIGGHGQVIFRRSAYDAAGGYDPTFRYAQDYDLWTRMTEHGLFGIVEDVLYRFRTGHDSITKSKSSAQTECALRVCRREYEKLTGIPLRLSTAEAMQNFWWAAPPHFVGTRSILAASRAMAVAERTYFRRNPQFAPFQTAVRRLIAARWKKRIHHVRDGDYRRKLVTWYNMFMWCLSYFTGRLLGSR